MNLPPIRPQKLIPGSLNQKSPSCALEEETQSELELTKRALQKLSKRRDHEGQLKRYLLIINFVINTWWYSSILAMAIRQLSRSLYRLANALTSFSIWAAPNWRSIQATMITFYGGFPWTDALTTIRTYWGIGQLLTFAQWYVHGIVEIGFALREFRYWSYPQKMVVIFTSAYLFFFILFASRAPTQILFAVFVGGISTVYIFARLLQDWAENSFRHN